MNNYTKAEIEYVQKNYGLKSYKQIGKELNISPVRVKCIARKHVLDKFSIGKSPFSSEETGSKNSVDNNFFNNFSNLSCYWAGFLAADGNISLNGKYIKLFLAEIDQVQVKNFKRDIKSESPITNGFIKYNYKGVESLKGYSSTSIHSKEIVKDLKNNFNLTPQKSLTLLPPDILDTNAKDCFIVGYIDGDGSIFQYKNKKQNKISISILGTLEILEWIQERFGEILGKKIKCIYKKDKDSAKNTYVLMISEKRARKIFLHYYPIEVPKLERKWSKENYEHCINFKKFKDPEPYIKLAISYIEGGSKKVIGERVGMSQSLVHWYLKEEFFKEILEEMKNKKKSL